MDCIYSWFKLNIIHINSYFVFPFWIFSFVNKVLISPLRPGFLSGLIILSLSFCASTSLEFNSINMQILFILGLMANSHINFEITCKFNLKFKIIYLIFNLIPYCKLHILEYRHYIWCGRPSTDVDSSSSRIEWCRFGTIILVQT